MTSDTMPGSERNAPISGKIRGTSPSRTLDMMRNSNSFPLLQQVLTRKKSDQKSGTSSKGTSSSSTTAAAVVSTTATNANASSNSNKSAVPRASPLGVKRSLPQDTPSGQGTPQGQGMTAGGGHASGGTMAQVDEGTGTGTSSEDLMIDNGSDTGTDDVDGENMRTKQVIEGLQAKIQRTKDAIRKEQNNKESIVNEYLQMATDKQPTARIKALFEKKNQKSGQSILQLQRKLENYQHRLTEVETHGCTGHKQAKEVLRDVGQGLKKFKVIDGVKGAKQDVVEGVIGAKDTIVSKPKEFAHLIKNKFGSADNIAQLKLDDHQPCEPDGKTGGTLPASFKYVSDDENSSITSGSGLGGAHSSPHSNAHAQQGWVLSSTVLDPLRGEMVELRESTQKVNDLLVRLAEEFDEYRAQMQVDVSLLRTSLEDERFRVERLEEQLNDLTELHQHEMHNLRLELSSMEEKIEYRLDERTTDLSDLMDSTSTRISRLEQQQQQQQILSMEMVENATFRTIISKLINVVLALLAVVLVFVSTAASFLSPFVHSTSRLLISCVVALLAWLLYQNYSYIETGASAVAAFLTWPWS